MLLSNWLQCQKQQTAFLPCLQQVITVGLNFVFIALLTQSTAKDENETQNTEGVTQILLTACEQVLNRLREEAVQAGITGPVAHIVGAANKQSKGYFNSTHSGRHEHIGRSVCAYKDDSQLWSL